MTTLRAAFDAAVSESTVILPVDSAIVESGRTLADFVDQARENGDLKQQTTAMYLLPHLHAVLRELLATPAARKAVGMVEKEKSGGTLAELRALSGNNKSA